MERWRTPEPKELDEAARTGSDPTGVTSDHIIPAPSSGPDNSIDGVTAQSWSCCHDGFQHGGFVHAGDLDYGLSGLEFPI